MTDFGYASDGTPVQCDDRGYWQDSWGNPYEVHEVTPARVVGPGEVIVKRDDLAYVMEFTSPGHFPEAGRLRAALADAEPAPDSGQGEAVTLNNGIPPQMECWACSGPVRETAGMVCQTCGRDYSASGGGTEADGGHDCAKQWRWWCEKCNPMDQDTPAAEPDRVTLPDTLTDEQVDNAVKTFNDLREKGAMRRALETVQPPKADPAETDAPMKWRPMDSLATHIKAAEDRAVKRGRDEALARVAEAARDQIAARLRQDNPLARDEWVIVNMLSGFADAINHEAGGDGHE